MHFPSDFKSVIIIYKGHFLITIVSFMFVIKGNIQYINLEIILLSI